MLYIHKLSDFAKKAVDIESVYLIRDLKKSFSLPLTPNKMEEHFSDFFISESDITGINAAIELIPYTVQMIEQIASRNDSTYETVNIHRALQVLKSCPEALENNIRFAREMMQWQTEFVITATELLNIIPTLKTQEEKVELNAQISILFERLLRNNELRFNYSDIIHEGHTGSLEGLKTSLANGSFFHRELEEELKKLTFEQIKDRIPPAKLSEVFQIQQDVIAISKSVKKAYEINMRVIESALNLYSLVKWRNS